MQQYHRIKKSFLTNKIHVWAEYTTLNVQFDRIIYKAIYKYAPLR